MARHVAPRRQLLSPRRCGGHRFASPCSLLVVTPTFFSVCGFSNAITFKTIDDDDINSVEQFVQNELDLCVGFSSNVQVNSVDDSVNLTSDENKVHFYGSYASNPKQFTFSAVDRKIIELLVTNVKQTVDFDGVNQHLGHFSQEKAPEETIGNDT